MTHHHRWALPLLLSLSVACAAEVPEAGVQSSAVRSSSFPADAPTLLLELGQVASADAGRFASYLDILYTDRAYAARLLEEARRLTVGSPTEHRLVLFVIGQLADEGSLDGLERELARCTPRPTPPVGRPRQLTCTPVDGDLPPSCSVPAHPETFDAIARGEAAQMLALDAFDQVGFRYQTTPVSQRFRAALDRVLADSRCGRPLRDAAALYRIERDPDPAAARRSLTRRYPQDTHFANLRWLPAETERTAPTRTHSGGRR